AGHRIEPRVQGIVAQELARSAFAAIQFGRELLKALTGCTERLRERRIVQELPESAFTVSNPRGDVVEGRDRPLELLVEGIVVRQLAERASTLGDRCRHALGRSYKGVELAVQRVVGKQLARGPFASPQILAQQARFVPTVVGMAVGLPAV